MLHVVRLLHRSMEDGVAMVTGVMWEVVVRVVEEEINHNNEHERVIIQAEQNDCGFGGECSGDCCYEDTGGNPFN